MNPVFIYSGPHSIHSKFAESVGSRFVDKRMGKIPLGILDVGMKSFNLPKSDSYLCEGGSFLPVALSSKKGKIIVHHSERFYGFGGANPADYPYRILNSLFLEKIDAVISTSEMVKKYFCEKTGLAVPHKVVNPFVEGEKEKVLLNASPNLKSNRVVAVSQNIHRKGLDILKKSFSEYISNFELHFVGEGSEHLDEPSSNVYGHGYLDSYEDVVEVMQRCSLLVQPSRYDFFGVSVAEAMRMGLPVVVTERTGIKEYVDDGFVSKVNAKDLAEKIFKYFDLKLSRRKKLSEKLKHRSQMFQEKKKLSEFRRKFKQLIEE